MKVKTCRTAIDSRKPIMLLCPLKGSNRNQTKITFWNAYTCQPNKPFSACNQTIQVISITSFRYFVPATEGEERHIAFGADPFGVGVRVAHYLHSISWTKGWILTKLAQIRYCEGGKKWLDFGDLDRIFNVTPALLSFQILPQKSLSAPYLLDQMTDSCQTSYIVTLVWIKDFVRFWWLWPNFQGHHIIKTVTFSNVNQTRLVCTLSL